MKQCKECPAPRNCESQGRCLDEPQAFDVEVNEKELHILPDGTVDVGAPLSQEDAFSVEDYTLHDKVEPCGICGLLVLHEPQEEVCTICKGLPMV